MERNMNLIGALGWIRMHTENDREYARALKQIYFNIHDIECELINNCGLTTEEYLEATKGLFD